LLKELLNKEKWGEKFSEKYVDEVLQNSMFLILRSGIEEAIVDFVEISRTIETYSIEQTIHIPLGGISMYGIEELSLGKVQIKKVTEATLNEILEATQAIIKTSKNSLEDQELITQKSNENLSSEFLDKVCSIYRVVAEPLRARELAEQETQRSLDLLRYSIPALYSDENRIRIDLSSQSSFSYQPTLIISSAGFIEDRRRLNRTYELSKSNLEVLKKARIFEVSNILGKPYEQVNDFEKTLLRGIHWFASSQTQIEMENEFLNLTTCLEVFFTPEGGDPISNSVAEGVAFILGKDLATRKRLKHRVKKLYGYRSRISHGGHTDILNQDLFDLKHIAMNLLIKMIEWREKFVSRKELIDHLEYQKLS
jgi:hypothetical protein